MREIKFLRSRESPFAQEIIPCHVSAAKVCPADVYFGMHHACWFVLIGDCADGGALQWSHVRQFERKGRWESRYMGYMAGLGCSNSHAQSGVARGISRAAVRPSVSASEASARMF